MKKVTIISLATVFIVLIAVVSCNKEQDMVVNDQSQEVIAMQDYGCSDPGLMLKSGLREIIFEVDVPSSVFETIELTERADVVIFAKDCCIPDDIVEIYVDECLIATIDAVDEDGESGSHVGETHTISLLAGTHIIEYKNIVSTVGQSGWNVSETIEAYTGNFVICPVIIDGCDTQVPNTMVEGGSMNELLDAIAGQEFKNHGSYVKEVAHLVESWYMAGLITEEEKDAIVACAAQSSYGVKK